MADHGSEDAESPAINELVRERAARRISRRELVRRAAALGVSAPVVGVMLHLTSDYAYGAPSNGGSAAFATRLADSTVPVNGPTKPSGTPQQGGILTVGTTEEPDTLHPWLTQLVTTNNIVSGMLDGLLTYDSTEKLQPALATALPEISKDGLTYTFKLRQGVKFHNGDPFTAQDVVNSWKMIVNPDFAAFSTQGWDQITDMQTPDEFTVVMKTKEVYAPFVSYVAGGNGGVSSAIAPSQEMAKGPDKFKQDYGQAPIGTGPFKFVEWQHKAQITMERFPDYWGEKAKLDKIIYRNVGDDNTLMVQLRTGEIHMADQINALRVDEALTNDKIVVLEHPSQAWEHIDLKNIGFLRETAVRQALDFATPSAEIISRLLKGRGLPSIADQAPGTWAYDPNIQPRPYDPEQAKKLLDGAGLKPGKDGVRERDGQPFEIELWGVSGDSLVTQVVQVIAAAWNQIGVKTSANFQDTSTIWGPEGYQFTDKMTGGYYSWFNGNDPDDSFYWNSSQIPKSPTGTGGNAPAFFYKYNFQDKIDALTNQGVKTIDQAQRKQIYWQIQELLHEEVPVIFIYWEKIFAPVTKNLGGYWPSSFNNLLWNAQDWYLTK